MTSEYLKSWLWACLVDRFHLMCLCLESTASSRWHTWESTWGWRWRPTRPTHPQLGPAKDGGRVRQSFLWNRLLLRILACTASKTRVHFHLDVFTNYSRPHRVQYLLQGNSITVWSKARMKTSAKSLKMNDHIMHIKSNMHVERASVHTEIERDSVSSCV